MKTLALIPVVLALTACGGGDDGCDVTYEVSGSNTQQRVSLTITLPNDTIGQATWQVYPTPHRETYRFKQGDFLLATGQNNNAWNAAFDVSIYVNGDLVDKRSGIGWSIAHAAATCR